MTGVHRWGWGEGEKTLAFWGWAGDAATAVGPAAVAWVWDTGPSSVAHSTFPDAVAGGLPGATGTVRPDDIPAAVCDASVGAVNHPRFAEAAATSVLSTESTRACRDTGAPAVSLDNVTTASAQATRPSRAVRGGKIQETVRG